MSVNNEELVDLSSDSSTVDFTNNEELGGYLYKQYFDLHIVSEETRQQLLLAFKSLPEEHATVLTNSLSELAAEVSKLVTYHNPADGSEPYPIVADPIDVYEFSANAKKIIDNIHVYVNKHNLSDRIGNLENYISADFSIFLQMQNATKASVMKKLMEFNKTFIDISTDIAKISKAFEEQLPVNLSHVDSLRSDLNNVNKLAYELPVVNDPQFQHLMENITDQYNYNQIVLDSAEVTIISRALDIEYQNILQLFAKIQTDDINADDFNNSINIVNEIERLNNFMIDVITNQRFDNAIQYTPEQEKMHRDAREFARYIQESIMRSDFEKFKNMTKFILDDGHITLDEKDHLNDYTKAFMEDFVAKKQQYETLFGENEDIQRIFTEIEKDIERTHNLSIIEKHVEEKEPTTREVIKAFIAQLNKSVTEQKLAANPSGTENVKPKPAMNSEILNYLLDLNPTQLDAFKKELHHYQTELNTQLTRGIAPKGERGFLPITDELRGINKLLMIVNDVKKDLDKSNKPPVLDEKQDDIPSPRLHT